MNTLKNECINNHYYPTVYRGPVIDMIFKPSKISLLEKYNITPPRNFFYYEDPYELPRNLVRTKVCTSTIVDIINEPLFYDIDTRFEGIPKDHSFYTRFKNERITKTNNIAIESIKKCGFLFDSLYISSVTLNWHINKTKGQPVGKVLRRAHSSSKTVYQNNDSTIHVKIEVAEKMIFLMVNYRGSWCLEHAVGYIDISDEPLSTVEQAKQVQIEVGDMFKTPDVIESICDNLDQFTYNGKHFKMIPYCDNAKEFKQFLQTFS